MTILLSSRGTWRSRLSSAGKRIKERLLRRLAMTQCSCQSSLGGREGRGGLAFPRRANREKRDCRASLAMTKHCRLAMTKTRPTHNSQKRDCRAALAMTKDCRLATPQGGFDKIQPRFAHDDKNTADSQQPEERLPRCARNPSKGQVTRRVL